MLHLKRSRSETLDADVAVGPTPPPAPTPLVPDAAAVPADSAAYALVPLGALPAAGALPRRVRIDAATGHALLAAGHTLTVCALPPAAGSDAAGATLELPADAGDAGDAGDAADAVLRVALFVPRGSGGSDDDALGALACTRAGQLRVWADVRRGAECLEATLPGLAAGDAVVRAACDRGTFFLATQAAHVHRLRRRADGTLAVLPPVPLPVAPVPAPAAAAQPLPPPPAGGLRALFAHIPFLRGCSTSEGSSSSSSAGEACPVPPVLVAVPARQQGPRAAADAQEDGACFVLTAGAELWRVDGRAAGAPAHLALADAVCARLAAEADAPRTARDVVCCAVFATAPQQCFVLAAVAAHDDSGGSSSAGYHAYIAQVEAETTDDEMEEEEDAGARGLAVVRVVRLGGARLASVRGVALAVTRSYNAFHAHVVARTRVTVGAFALGIDAVGAVVAAHDVAELAADGCLAGGLDRAGHAVVVAAPGSTVLGVRGRGLGPAAEEERREQDKESEGEGDDDSEEAATAAAAAALEDVYRRFGQPGILNSVVERAAISAALAALAARGAALDAAVLRVAHRVADKRPELDLGAAVAAVAAVPAAAAAAAALTAPMVTMTHLEQKARKYAALRALVRHAYAPHGACLEARLAPATRDTLAALGEWLAAACGLRRVLADANERAADNALAACVRAYTRTAGPAGTDLFSDVSRLAAFVPALAQAVVRAAGAQDRAAVLLGADALDALTAPLTARTLAHAVPAPADALVGATDALARTLAATTAADAAAAPDFAVRARPVLERLVRQVLVALRTQALDDADVPADADAAAQTDVLLDAATYQTRAGHALHALLDAGLVARAHALGLEFAVTEPLIAACERLDSDSDSGDDATLREAMAQLGPKFERAVFAHWDAGSGAQRRKLFGGDGAQQAAAAAYLEAVHSADLYLALLRLHRYGDAARELCVRAEGARDKARRCELASLGRMAAALAGDAPGAAAWAARLACVLQDVATQNLDPALRAQAACAAPRETVAALAHTGEPARVAAAADLVGRLRACGRCGAADAAALAETLWRTVLQLTPWRRLARLSAEGRLADTRLEAAIRDTPFCVCAQHVLAHQGAGTDSDSEDSEAACTRRAIAGALDFYRGCVQPVSDQLEAILATLHGLSTTVIPDGSSAAVATTTTTEMSP